MARKAILDAIRARQEANWTTVPVYYPNEQTSVPLGLTAFVFVSTPIGSSDMLTLGGATRGYLDDGGIRFTIHVAVDDGYETAFTYADELADIFRNVSLSVDGGRLNLWAPGPPIPEGKDGAYYRVGFSVPYSYHFSA